jgi:hypothetical protein
MITKIVGFGARVAKKPRKVPKAASAGVSSCMSCEGAKQIIRHRPTMARAYSRGRSI